MRELPQNISVKSVVRNSSDNLRCGELLQVVVPPSVLGGRSASSVYYKYETVKAKSVDRQIQYASAVTDFTGQGTGGTVTTAGPANAGGDIGAQYFSVAGGVAYDQTNLSGATGIRVYVLTSPSGTILGQTEISLEAPDLSADIEDILGTTDLVLKVGETKNLKQLLANAGLVHIDCANVEEPTLTATGNKSGDNVATVSDTTIKGNSPGWAEVSFTLVAHHVNPSNNKDLGCAYHPFQTYTGTRKIYVMANGDLTATMEGAAVNVANATPGMTYRIADAAGTVYSAKCPDNGNNVSISIEGFDFGDESNYIATVQEVGSDRTATITIDRSKLHMHSWTYAVDEDDVSKIVAHCSGEGECGVGDKTLQLVAPASTSLTYDNTLKAATLTDDGIAQAGITAEQIGDITYEGTSGTTYAASTTAPRKAGTYKATVTVTPTGSDPITAEVTYTIAKATGSQQALTDDQKPTAKSGLVYNDQNQQLAAAPASLPDGYTKVQYSTDNGATWSDGIPTGKNAGDYPIKVKYVGDENHADFEGEALTGTIAKKPISPTMADLDKTFDNEAVEPSLIEDSNPGEGEVTYTFWKKNGNDWQTISGAPSGAGTYKVVGSVAETDNYAQGTTPEATFSIGKANPTVTAPEPEPGLSYTGSPRELIKAGRTTGGIMQYSLDGNTWSTDIPTATVKGTYTVYYKVAGNNDYNDVAPKSFVVEMRSRELTEGDDYDITLSQTEFTYNGQPQTPTITITLKDGTTLVENTDFEVEYDPDTTNASSYDKYATITFKGNYAGKAVDKTYKISPKTLTEQEVTFAGDSYTYTGIPQGPAITVKDGTTTLAAPFSYSVTGATATEVGTYTASVTGKGNYKGTVTHSYSITKATTQESNLDENQKPTAKEDLVYDGRDQALVSAPEYAVPGYTVNYSLDGETWTTTPPTGKNAGNYTVHVKYVGDANHTDFAGSDIQVAIGQKTVTITPQAGQSKVYGEPDPATYTYSQSGVVSGETLNGTLGRQSGENVGEYAFNVSEFTANGANPNYDVKLADSAPTFSITKAGQETPVAPSLTATYDSITVANGTAGVTYTLYKEGTTEPAMTIKPTVTGPFNFTGLDPNANYTVKAQVLGDSNHDPSGVSEASITTPKAGQSAPTTPELQQGATSLTANNGVISGVDDTMEYSTDGGATWTPVPNGETTITGLPAGEVLVRREGTTTMDPSPAKTVSVTFTLSGAITWNYQYKYNTTEGEQTAIVHDDPTVRSKQAKVELLNGSVVVATTTVSATGADGDETTQSPGNDTYTFEGLSTTIDGVAASYTVRVTPLVRAQDSDEQVPAAAFTATMNGNDCSIIYTQECFDATWTVNIAKMDSATGAVPDVVYVKVLYGTTQDGGTSGTYGGYDVITQQTEGYGVACAIGPSQDGKGYTATGSFPVWKYQSDGHSSFYHKALVTGYQINGRFYSLLSNPYVVSEGDPMTFTGEAASGPMVVNIADLKVPMVEFDPNGGAIDNGYLLVDATGANAGKVTVAQINAKAPTWPNHTFDGWYTKTAGGTKQTTDITDITQKTTLYAHWNMVVDPAANAPTANAGLIYNGTAQTLVTKPDELPEGCEKVRYSIDGGTTWTDDLPTAVNAGTYTVKVKYVGDGAHADAVGADVQVTIKPKPLTSDDIVATGKGTSLVYSGQPQGPTVAVKDGATTLEEGTSEAPKDYVLTNTTATAAGSYAVSVTGTGNYTGTVQVPYAIAPYEIGENDTVVVSSASNFTYDGTDQRPTGVTVTLNEDDLREGPDFEITYPAASVNAGNYEITVTFKNNYAGTTTKGYKIVPKLLTDASITIADAPSTFVFSGTSQGPAITLRDSAVGGGTVLAQGADYVLTGEKATGVGDGYKATITGTGNYMGRLEKPYAIVPYELGEGDSIEVLFPNGASDEAFTYNGTDQHPSADGMKVRITRKDGSVVELTSSDFDVAYLTADGTPITTSEISKNAGTYQVQVTLKDTSGYTGSAKKGYVINPKPITDADVNFGGTEFTYDGGPHEPTAVVGVTLVAGGPKVTLNAPQDYTVADAPKTDAGSYTMLIKGKGNYTGEVTKPYAIGKAAPDPTSFSNTNKPTPNKTGDKDGLVYNGTSQELVSNPETMPEGYTAMLYSTDDGETWVEAPEAIDAGTYSVKVKYVGDKNHEDIVVEAPLTATILRRALTITGKTDGKPYNGAEQKLDTYDYESVTDATTTTTGLLRGTIAHSISGLTYLAAGTTAGEYDGAFTPSDKTQVAIVDAKNDYADVSANYDITLTPGKLTITAADLTDDGTIDASFDDGKLSVTGSQGSGAPTYDAQPHKPVVVDKQATDENGDPAPKTLEEGKDYTVTYYVADENGQPTATVTNATDAGNKVAVITLAGGDYTGEIKVRMDVAPRPVIFTGETDTRAYNGKEQQLTGITTGGSGLVEGHTHNLSYLAKGTKADSHNGAFSYASGAQAVILSGSDDVTSNYQITETPGALVIEKAKVDENQDGTPDNLTDANGSTVTDGAGKPVPIVSLSGSDGEGAPVYDDKDHKPTVVDNSFVNPSTGNRKPKTLVENTDYTVAYYEANPDGTPNTEKPITGDDAPKQAGNKVAVITFIGDFDGSLTVPVDVKKCPVTFAGKSVTAYFNSQAQNLSTHTTNIAAGSPDGAAMDPSDGKATTYTVSGLIEGHTTTPAEAGAADTVSYDATGQYVGAYEGTFADGIAIYRTDGTSVTANYEITTTAGTLTIIPAVLEDNGEGWGVIPAAIGYSGDPEVIQVEGAEGTDAPVYNGAPQEPVVTDKQSGHEPIVLEKGRDYDVAYYAPNEIDATTHKPIAGAHALTPEEAGEKVAVVTLKTNVAGTIAARMDVAKRPMSITGDSETRMYTGAEQQVTTYTAQLADSDQNKDCGLVAGHTIEGLSHTAKGTAAGAYTGAFIPQQASNVVIMSGSTNVSANYAVTLVPGTLTINKAKVDGSGNLVDDQGHYIDEGGIPTNTPVKVVDVTGAQGDNEPLYDGTPKEPVVYDEAAEGGRKRLEQGTLPDPLAKDYTVAYYEPQRDAGGAIVTDGNGVPTPDTTKPANPADAGEKVAVVTLTGDYEGVVHVPMNVKKRAVSFTGEFASVPFDGQQHTITGVTVGGDGLARNQSHNVTYTATGTEKSVNDTDYVGQITPAENVRILDANSRDVTKNYTITTALGKLTIGAMTVVDDGNGHAVKADADGNPITDDQGNPEVLVTVTLDYDNANPPTYDGTAHAPSAHDNVLDQDLVEDEDYVVHYYEAVKDSDGNPTREPDLNKPLLAADAGDKIAVVAFTKDYNGEVAIPANVLPRPVVFTGNSATVSYTGQKQEVTGYTSSTGQSEGLLTGAAFGHTTVVESKDTVVASASGTGVGVHAGTITAAANVVILDKNGNEQTRNYTVATVPGTLTINPAKVTDVGNGKVYQTDENGNPVGNDGQQIKTDGNGKPAKDGAGNLVDPEGNTLTPAIDVKGSDGENDPTYDGTPKEPVITDNRATNDEGAPAPKTLKKGEDYDVAYFEPKRDDDGNVVTDKNGTPVPDTTKPVDPADAGEKVAVITLTGDYDGTVNVPMNVEPRPLHVTTQDATKEYDGTPLVNADVTVQVAGSPGVPEGQGLVGGQTIEVIVTGSQTEPGSSANTVVVRFKDEAKDKSAEGGVMAESADEAARAQSDAEPGLLDFLAGLFSPRAAYADASNGLATDGSPTAKRSNYDLVADAADEGTLTVTAANVGDDTGKPGEGKRVVVTPLPSGDPSKGPATDANDKATYTGKPVAGPELYDTSVTDENGNPKKLEEGTDYTVTYYEANPDGTPNLNKPITGKPSDAGSYAMVVTYTGGYEGTYTTPVTIAKAKLTVKTPSASKTYDGKALTTGEKDASITGFVNGESAPFEVTGTQTEVGSSKNTYKIGWDDASATAKEQNYEVAETLGTLKVTARKSTTTSSTKSSGTSRAATAKTGDATLMVWPLAAGAAGALLAGVRRRRRR